MVVARARSCRTNSRLLHGRIDDLLRYRLRLAKPRADRAGSVAAIVSCLEKCLRHFYRVAGLKLNVLRRIAAKLTDIVNFHFVAPQKTHPFLIGKVVEPS